MGNVVAEARDTLVAEAQCLPGPGKPYGVGCEEEAGEEQSWPWLMPGVLSVGTFCIFLKCRMLEGTRQGV